MTTNNGSGTTIEERLGADQVAKLKARVGGNGKAVPKKARVQAAEAAIDEAAAMEAASIEDLLATHSDLEGKIAAEVAKLQLGLGNAEGRLTKVEEKVGALEAPKPSWFEQLQALRKQEGEPAKAQRKELGQAVDQMQTEHLPWGVRHIEKARRSTVGKSIENAVIVAAVVTAAALGGKAGYNKIKG